MGRPTKGSVQIDEKAKLRRFLCYAVEPNKNDRGNTQADEGVTLEMASLGASNSFLDYDGALLLAGAFEGRDRSGNLVCLNRADLDARETEFSTLYERGMPFIFLVQPQSDLHAHIYELFLSDLFKRVCARFQIGWRSLPQPYPALKATSVEFRDYASRFGTGYVLFTLGTAEPGTVRVLFEGGDGVFGLAVNDQVFFLPCVIPRPDQIPEIANAAALATVKFRERVSSELPTWTAGFVFEHEAKLLQERDAALKRVAELEGTLGVYSRCKGALCWQSDPLIAIVKDVFQRFFDINLCVDDKFIEDAVIRDSNNNIQAVVEIKGVKGDFKRENVNQVDSHRERLGLGPNTPGILIMNTRREATSLSEKDRPPDSGVVKKAFSDRVLLVRTLDLLRLADLVEKGFVSADQISGWLIGAGGWLKVEDGSVEIVGG